MSLPRRLAGRGALVTGASSGIGRGVAIRLAEEGAVVLCCDLARDAPPGEHAATHDAIPSWAGRPRSACDVRDADSVERAFEALDAPLDICVLNAGVFVRGGTIVDETVAAHDHTMLVNERGVWLGLRAAAPRMIARGGGRIVCTASISGLAGRPGEASYCASKGAVVNLVRAAAVDLAPYAINVNAVCPGFVETPMTAGLFADPEARAPLDAATPWPRLGTPDDIAAAVSFLVSDDAAWITGVALPVDGGYMCV